MLYWCLLILITLFEIQTGIASTPIKHSKGERTTRQCYILNTKVLDLVVSDNLFMF